MNRLLYPRALMENGIIIYLTLTDYLTALGQLFSRVTYWILSLHLSYDECAYRKRPVQLDLVKLFEA